MDTLMKWLRGEPVQIAGTIYIFPHGTPAIRRLLSSHSSASQ